MEHNTHKNSRWSLGKTFLRPYLFKHPFIYIIEQGEVLMGVGTLGLLRDE